VADWWRGFFQGRWEEVQLSQGADEDANRVDADKIEAALRLPPGSTVLDVPCGEGRISLELAARGYAVTGVDASSAFVAEARRRAVERGVSSRFEEGDMRELPFESEFDAAINFGGSFGYFDDAENNRVAASACRALRPGGRYLIDTVTSETIFPDFRNRLWYEAGGVLVLVSNRYDPGTGRIEADWMMVGPEGSRELQHSSMRIYSFAELQASMQAAGFDHVEGFDTDALEPFHLGASRLFLVATKVG
jgi:ubiquinone/menaquinone biosynthesis C-methylase UbiE